MSILFPFQKKGIRWISHFKGRALLADEMGLGKTLQALQWVKENPQTALPALVICPAHLKWVWEQEAATKVGMLSRILSGTKPKKKGISIQPPITIINYAILGPWSSELSKQEFKTLILDEVHFIKNRAAQRTKNVLHLAKDIPHVLALSGTPLLNCPAELWPTINLLKSSTFDSFLHFAQRYCNPEYKNGKWVYKGAEHLQELHRRLRKHMLIRRLKVDVLPELPSKIRTVVPVEIKMKEYQQATDDFILWLKKKYPTKVYRAKKALILTRMGYLKRLASELKYDMVKKWIDSFLAKSDDKLVVFGVHKKIVRAMHDEYPKISVVLDGGTSSRDKKRAVHAFQHQKKIRIFFGNIIAAGTGITLTAASNVLFTELDWTPTNHTQAEDRPHRIGQKDTVNITYIVAKGTIEEKLCELIQLKQEIVTSTLDGKVSKKNSFNLYDSLIRSIMKKKK